MPQMVNIVSLTSGRIRISNPRSLQLSPQDPSRTSLRGSTESRLHFDAQVRLHFQLHFFITSTKTISTSPTNFRTRTLHITMDSTTRRESTFLSLAPLSYSNWTAPVASPTSPASATEDRASPLAVVEPLVKTQRSSSQSSDTSARFLRLGHVDTEE